eukprot:gene23297-gene442
MHHHTMDRERALNLSILTLSVKLSRILHALWRHPVNSFKFQPCECTPPWNEGSKI